MRALIPERLERGRLRYERLGSEHDQDLPALMAEPRVLETLWPWPDPPTRKQLSTDLANGRDVTFVGLDHVLYRRARC